jgi:hypothetical protein
LQEIHLGGGFTSMKKLLAILMATLAFFAGPPAQAGIGFGIPLPFPFLVWTPSGHYDQGHRSCHTRDQESSANNKRSEANGAPAGTKGS